MNKGSCIASSNKSGWPLFFYLNGKKILFLCIHILHIHTWLIIVKRYCKIMSKQHLQKLLQNYTVLFTFLCAYLVTLPSSTNILLQLQWCIGRVVFFMPRWSDRWTFRCQPPRHKPFFGSARVIVIRIKQRHSRQYNQQARTSDNNTE